MNRKIIGDTSVWIEYFKNNPVVTDFMEKNLLEDNIYIIGIIVSELIQGIKNEEERSIIRSNLDAVSYIEMKYEDWISVGDLSSDLRKKGVTLPLTDIAIASVAKKNNFQLATFDRHFKLIPNLTVYEFSKN